LISFHSVDRRYKGILSAVAEHHTDHRLIAIIDVEETYTSKFGRIYFIDKISNITVHSDVDLIMWKLEQEDL
jgi:hypothetical protein